MNAPPTFNTGDPSYRMAASTPGSANPAAFTAAERIPQRPRGATSHRTRLEPIS